MTKTKHSYEEAMAVAEKLVTTLKPCCEQICIAGSLRRGKREVGDIEILYVPRMVSGRQVDMFSSGMALDNAAEFKIEWLEREGVLERRKNVEGHNAGWGPKNKLGVHVESGIAVDLFETTKENWFVSLVIRTGPKEFNLRLTNGAIALGRTLNAYGCGITEMVSGTVTRATSEQDVCKLCGVEYAEPERRK